MIGSIEDVLCKVYLHARDLREAESKRYAALVVYLTCADTNFLKRPISHL